MFVAPITSTLTALRLAARSLVAARGFTVTAIVTLALGMTLSTAATVVLGAYLLNSLPYPEADRLYWIRYGAPGQEPPRDMAALDWASLEDVIEHPIAWDLDAFYMLGGDHVEMIPGAWVTQGFVRGLGIQPALGRGFGAGAFASGAPNVVLISDRLWRSRFGADANIVGRTFTAYVSDRPDEAEHFTIVGVMPRGFWHINPYTDILTPLRAPTFPYMARLRDGVSPADAASRITALVAAGARGVPQNWAATVVSAHANHVQAVRPVLQAVSGAALLVLLVGCANVACLLLVRATRRQKEMAVRVALGAGRGAIARMLLAEGILIAGAASVLALLLTRLTIDSIAPTIQLQLGRSAPGGLPAFAINVRTIAITVGIAVATAALCALVPLLPALGAPVAGRLHGGSRTMTEGGGSQRVRAGLIAIQVALSLTLLCGSALMLRSVISLVGADLGFDAERVLNTSITLRHNRYPDQAARAAVFERLMTGLRSLTGVEAVGMTTAWPVQQPAAQTIERREASARVTVRTAVQGINDDYFKTLAIPTRAGRAFTAADRAGKHAGGNCE